MMTTFANAILMLVSLITVDALFPCNNTEISPQDEVLGIGSTLTLSCRDNNVEPISRPQDMYFTFKHFYARDETRIFQTGIEVVDLRTKRLTVENVSLADNGYYYCKIQKLGQEEQTCDGTLVTILEPPLLTDHLNCQSANFQDMTCVLPVGSIQNYTNYTFWYSNSLGDDYVPCPRVIRHGSGCYFKTIKRFVSYNFKIIGRNAVGERMVYNGTVYTRTAIVIPSPVSSIKVSSSGSDHLEVGWNVPLDMGDVIKARIQYQITYTETQTDRIIKATNITGQTAHQFRGLHAFTYYTITVEARMLTSPYWSNCTSLTTRTKASAACSGPNLIKDAYRTFPNTNNDYYKLQIFYQEYNASCLNGIIQNYSITYEYPNDANSRRSVSTLENEYSVVLEELNKFQQYRICLTAYTGDTENSTLSYQSPETCVLIQKLDQWLPPLERIYAETNSNKSVITFHMKAPKILDYVLLLICTPSDIDRTQCKNSSIHIFHQAPYQLQHFREGDVYALSTQYNGISSNMKPDWIIPCQHNAVPSKLDLHLTSASHILKAEWTRPACGYSNNKVHIDGYEITIVDNNEENTKQIRNGWKTHILFYGIKNDVRYTVSIRAVSNGGIGPETIDSTVIHSAGLSSTRVAVVGCIGSLVLFGIIIYLGIACSKTSNKDIDIRLPDVFETPMISDTSEEASNLLDTGYATESSGQETEIRHALPVDALLERRSSGHSYLNDMHNGSSGDCLATLSDSTNSSREEQDIGSTTSSCIEPYSKTVSNTVANSIPDSSFSNNSVFSASPSDEGRNPTSESDRWSTECDYTESHCGYTNSGVCPCTAYTTTYELCDTRQETEIRHALSVDALLERRSSGHSYLNDMHNNSSGYCLASLSVSTNSSREKQDIGSTTSSYIEPYSTTVSNTVAISGL